MTYETVFWIMAATWLVSLLYPWRQSWPKAKWLVHLPWALIPLWIRYESLMPAGMNIRIDLLLIVWGLGVAFIVYAIRLVAFWFTRRKHHSAKPPVSGVA